MTAWLEAIHEAGADASGTATGPDAQAAIEAVCVSLGDAECSAHEAASLRFAAARLGALLGLPVVDEARGGAGRCYWLPAATLSRGEADALGIVDGSQLWGGVVPHPLVATKLVSHPLLPGAAVPAGWRDVDAIAACTLPGWSVFSRQDALEAGRRLLQDGAIRAKCPYARGGHGQARIGSLAALERWLASPEAIGLEAGLVLERDLVRAVTYSIGCSALRGHRIAYHGEQRSVVDRLGDTVYGGSVLRVFRGDLAHLQAHLQAQLADEMAEAAQAALLYDRAVCDAHGVVASRRNYDVIVGVDAQGHRHCGVLEQSWRFGGASMAELLALECLAANPATAWVLAETVETYAGEPDRLGAIVYWPGDARSPRKYARIIAHGC